MLVHGASGGVGLAAVSLACAFGIKVIGTASSPEGAKLVKERGASLVVNHREEGYIEQIMQFTEGKGVNIILEMLANQNLGAQHPCTSYALRHFRPFQIPADQGFVYTLTARDLSMLAMRGRVCVVGSRGPIEIDPRCAHMAMP